MTPQTQTSTLHPPITLVSHPRRHDNPLTPSEVADIRSLLGAAAGAAAADKGHHHDHGHGVFVFIQSFSFAALGK